ncbi:MAG: hypothetical protein ACLP7Q_07195 [Isosphaeraceae bacterium]
MTPVFADFNAMTETGQVRLNCQGSRDDLRAGGLHPGDWAWLTDGELIVGGKIDSSPEDGVVAIPDWKTLVHLDEPYEAEVVYQELRPLLERPDLDFDDLWRAFRLLTICERVAPPAVLSGTPSGYFSFRRATMLLQLQELDLALVEILEARRLEPGRPNHDFLFLEILREVNLPKAIRTVEEFALNPALDAKVLAGCIHVLATHADQLADEAFQVIAQKILEFADRFDHAPSRDRIPASILALVQFNRGLVQLRQERLEDARRWLDLASTTDPTAPELVQARNFTSFDEHAREIALQYNRRSIAA